MLTKYDFYHLHVQNLTEDEINVFIKTALEYENKIKDIMTNINILKSKPDQERPLYDIKKLREIEMMFIKSNIHCVNKSGKTKINKFEKQEKQNYFSKIICEKLGMTDINQMELKISRETINTIIDWISKYRKKLNYYFDIRDRYKSQKLNIKDCVNYLNQIFKNVSFIKIVAEKQQRQRRINGKRVTISGFITKPQKQNKED